MNKITTKKYHKHVTVLFVDIVKSSYIVQNYDSEIAAEIFNNVITQQIKIVQKFKGTVNQVMGDGIMCLFGVEDNFEEHTLHAISAGQEMLKTVTDIQKKYKNIPIKIRIGINTGDVILNKPQNDSYHAEYQATGEPVHLTDKLLKKAKPNQMLISPSSMQFLKRYYSLKQANTLTWEDETKPIKLYKIDKLKKIKKTNSTKINKQHLTRKDIKKKIQSITPNILWLYGEAGVGKTQVANNFFQKYCKDKICTTVQINFYPNPLSNTSNSFEHMILENLFGKNKNLIFEKLKQKKWFESKEAPTFIDDCIKDILQLSNLNVSYQSLDTSIKARMQTEAVAYVILSIAKTKKLLLILEDMHWAKEKSICYIEKLLEKYNNHKNLSILATSRNKPPFDRLLSENKISQIIITPMERKESLALIKKLDKKKLLPPAINKTIHELSGGNPYFINEYFNWVQSLLAQDTTIKAIKKKLNDHTPDQIKDILYNKVASMDSEVIQTARVASALGMKINFNILLAVLGIDRSLLKNILQKLEAQEIIKQHRFFPSQEWVFTHQLLQKVIYNSNPKSVKTQIHSTIIKQLQKPEFKLTNNKHMIMATHAKKAQNHLLHYIYSKWAAQAAHSQSLHQSCIKLSKNSKKALTKIKRGQRYKKQEILADLLEINSFFILGQYYLAKKKIDALAKKTSSLKTFGYYSQVLSLKELHLWIKGDLSGAIEISKKILALPNRRNKYTNNIRENARLANLHLDTEQYKESITHALKVINTIKKEDNTKKFTLLVQAKPMALSNLTLAYAKIGDAKNSRVFFNETYDFIANNNDIFTKIYALIYMGHSLIEQEKYAQAIPLLKEANNYCEKISSDILKPYALSAYGVALAKTGDVARGVKYCKQALKLAVQKNLSSRVTQFEIWYAEALMLQKNHQQAKAHHINVLKEQIFNKEAPLQKEFVFVDL